MYDFDNPAMVGGVIVFPSWAFEEPPRPLPIIETVYVTGQGSNTVNVFGNPDTEENWQ